MAELTVQNIAIAGATKATLVAADAAGDTFDNDGKTFIEVANGAGSPITVTITGQVSLQHGIAATKTVSVTNATTFMIGPFPERFFNTDGANEVSITYSDVATITVAAYSAKDVHA